VPSSLRNAIDADAPPRRIPTLAAALVVSLVAFALYRSSLLPGVDFGDSGSIQTTIGSPLLTPRDGYPLYFAIDAAVLRLTGAEPAHAANLTSAIEGAVACGALVVVCAELVGALAPAVAAALLFGVSYTFWSQCVTAEVYALHIAFVLASLYLLLRWERRPTTARLALFFGCYALGFGNHLSMILLAPGFTLFLVLVSPRGWRGLLTPRIIGLAAGMAAIGAMQYAWNIRTLWFLPQPPDTMWATAQTFWFDVTKSDWRDTMMLSVPQSMLRDHAAMYWFDLRQQFGVPGAAAALVGAIDLAWRVPRRAALIFALYAANLAFAFGYNVGDAHVFYLPSHLMVALLAGAGAAAAGNIVSRRLPRGAAFGVALALYAAARAYADFPALDRSRDDRAITVLDSLTSGVDDQRSILLVDLNWQIANGLSYFAKVTKPEVAAVRVRDVLLYAPALVRANLLAGRDVLATAQAARLLTDAYGPMFETRLEREPETLDAVARGVPAGTRYVLCVLKPTRDFPMDRDDLGRALRTLNGGSAVSMPPGDYVVEAGVAGQRATLAFGSDVPFAKRVDIAGVSVEMRMEAWLAADTIRRMGFGHVVTARAAGVAAPRHHALIVERGISFATFDDQGSPLRTAYFAGLFEMPERYLVW
jgi:hypothetical protein